MRSTVINKLKKRFSKVSSCVIHGILVASLVFNFTLVVRNTWSPRYFQVQHPFRVYQVLVKALFQKLAPLL